MLPNIDFDVSRQPANHCLTVHNSHSNVGIFPSTSQDHVIPISVLPFEYWHICLAASRCFTPSLCKHRERKLQTQYHDLVLSINEETSEIPVLQFPLIVVEYLHQLHLDYLSNLTWSLMSDRVPWLWILLLLLLTLECLLLPETFTCWTRYTSVDSWCFSPCFIS
jgi:hypothetical protein